MRIRTKKTGFVLALGGGGARGLAHIGVLKVLEREGVDIKAITGTSMGAVIGAMYAVYRDAVEVEEIVRKFLSSSFHEKYAKAFFILSEDPDVLHAPEKIARGLGKRFLYVKAASTRAVFSSDILDEAFRHLLPDVRFSDLEVPFACVATDLQTGKEVILDRGRLLPSVIASSSIPGFMDPIRISQHLLVDGSTVSVVPVAAARRLFGGKVLAVEVPMDLERDAALGTAFEIAMRAAEITGYHLSQTQLSNADVSIHPKVGKFTWANFDKLDEMIRAGEVAAQKTLSSLI